MFEFNRLGAREIRTTADVDRLVEQLRATLKKKLIEGRVVRIG